MHSDRPSASKPLDPASHDDALSDALPDGLSGGLSDSLDRFRHPDKSARAKLRWWWPGGAVDIETLHRQLGEFDAAGFGGVEVQPFRIGLPQDLDEPARRCVQDFATPGFRAKLAALVARARELGLTVDMTFGSCWPMGGGIEITPELAAHEVTLAWTGVVGPVRYAGRPAQPERPQRSGTWLHKQGHLAPEHELPPAWQQRMGEREQIVAVLALRGGTPALQAFTGFVALSEPDRWGEVQTPGLIDAAATLDLTDRLDHDGHLEWDVPEGEWQIVVCKRFVTDQLIGEAVGAGPQLVIDHLNREAFDTHARRVGGGNRGDAHSLGHIGLHAIFEDSLEIAADLHWTDDFLQEFERRRGYALRPYLPLALHPGWRNPFQARAGAPLFDDPEAGPRVRADYRLTVSELMIERHYAAFAEWATQQGLRSRLQAHGSPTDWIRAYGLCTMPETEDLMGGAAAHFMRVARAAAHVYGRGPVSAEAFVWIYDGLAVTPRHLRERADKMFACGVQQIVGHGASYPFVLRPDAESWYPWRDFEFGTMLDSRNPVWRCIAPLAAYIARTQTLLREGKAVVRCAVLAPLDLFAFDGAACQPQEPVWHSALQDAGYDWDWINEHGLMRSRLSAAGLVTEGGHRYEALIVPALQALRHSCAQRLAEAAAAGVKLVFLDGTPHREEGWVQAAERDLIVRDCVQRILREGGCEVAAAQAGEALRRLGVAASVRFGGCALSFVERETGDRRIFFFRNESTEPVKALLDFPTGLHATRWDAWTGEVRALPSRNGAAQPLAIKLELQGLEAAIVVLSPRPVPAALEPSRLPPEAWVASQALSAARWIVHARGYGQQGRRIDVECVWPSLQDTSELAELTDFAGELSYRIEIEVSREQLDRAPSWLFDLGRVQDVAEITVNGSTPVAMSEGPFVADVTAALRAGVNLIEVITANVPENALRDPRNPGGIPVPGRRLDKLPCGWIGPAFLRASSEPVTTRWRVSSRKQPLVTLPPASDPPPSRRS